ncbi:hypothetical protein FQR65_LT16908 [Abscondita terminalis]|nr:hypothetical protein FQR65_LT16908 [Abscondita terminalis]
MFSFVRFEDNLLTIVKSSKITKWKDGTYAAPYKNAGRFPAEVIISDDSRDLVQKKYDFYNATNDVGSRCLNKLKASNLEETIDYEASESEYEPSDVDSSTSSNNHISEEFCEDEIIRSIQERTFVDVSPVKPEEQQVHTSKNSKQKHFCMYCKKKCSDFARHIAGVHKEETDVKSFINLPKGSKERKNIIEAIRKRGDCMYNTNSNHNTGDLIVTRRPQAKKSRDSNHYLPCGNCKAFYSKLTLRRHYRKCAKASQKGERGIMVHGRMVRSNILKTACPMLRFNIIPQMRDDEVTQAIRYDDLIISYANKLTVKYSAKQHFNMIRSKLRLLGKLLLEIKKINKNITKLSDVFIPTEYDNVIKCVQEIGKLSSDGTRYTAPATATSLGTLIKKVANHMITDMIKSGNDKKIPEIQNFLKLMVEDFPLTITRAAIETMAEMKRRKKVELPTMTDVKAINSFLKRERQKLVCQLKSSFSKSQWKALLEVTLTSLQLFNRKRPGEIERMLIEDYTAAQSISQDVEDPIFKSLSDCHKKKAADYVKINIRGKLGRSVPVLVHKELGDCMKLCLNRRSLAGVHTHKPYVFGVSGSARSHLSACVLMRKFSKKCGAQHPERLRATELRKHIATHSQLLDLKESEVSDLAKFMGHADKIHMDHYRQPIISREIGRISTLLINAQGDCESKDDDLMTTPPKENSDFKNNSKIRRNVSPIGKVVRKSWSSMEISAMEKTFKKYLQNKTLPPTELCSKIAAIHPSLQERSPQQIRAWVNNKNKMGNSEARSIRKSWSPEENRIVNMVFQDFFTRERLPSLQECQAAIDKYDVLKNRTAVILKAHINNITVKQKKMRLERNSF